MLGWGRAYIIVQLGSCTINGIYRCTFSWGLRVRNNSPLASISSFSTDLKRIPHTLFRGPWFHNSIVRLQISSLSIEPLQVIWKSLLKAISGDNRRFCLQNQWINRSLKKQTGCQNSSTLPCSDSPNFIRSTFKSWIIQPKSDLRQRQGFSIQHQLCRFHLSRTMLFCRISGNLETSGCSKNMSVSDIYSFHKKWSIVHRLPTNPSLIGFSISAYKFSSIEYYLYAFLALVWTKCL